MAVVRHNFKLVENIFFKFKLVEIVDRGSEKQIQVTEYLNWIIQSWVCLGCGKR